LLCARWPLGSVHVPKAIQHVPPPPKAKLLRIGQILGGKPAWLSWLIINSRKHLRDFLRLTGLSVWLKQHPCAAVNKKLNFFLAKGRRMVVKHTGREKQRCAKRK